MDWGGESDHNPILLEISSDACKPPCPFKFNSAWISDPGFCDLVKSLWIPMNDGDGSRACFSFMENLMGMKKKTLCWAEL